MGNEHSQKSHHKDNPIRYPVDVTNLNLCVDCKTLMKSYADLPTLCPECPCGNVLYFLVDGKCHHCGCVVIMAKPAIAPPTDDYVDYSGEGERSD